MYIKLPVDSLFSDFVFYLCRHFPDFPDYIGNHPGPVSGDFLAEYSRGGIPWGIGPIEEPSPLPGIAQHDPDGLSQCSGEVSDCRIDAYHHVEIFYEGRSFREVRQLFAKATIWPRDSRSGLSCSGTSFWQAYNIHVKTHQGRKISSRISRVWLTGSRLRPAQARPILGLFRAPSLFRHFSTCSLAALKYGISAGIVSSLVAQCQGQAHQRAVEIMGGQSVACVDMIDTRQSRDLASDRKPRGVLKDGLARQSALQAAHNAKTEWCPRTPVRPREESFFPQAFLSPAKAVVKNPI